MWIERTEKFTATSEDADTYLKQLKEKYIIKIMSITTDWSRFVTVKVTYDVNMDKIVTVNWKEKEN